MNAKKAVQEAMKCLAHPGGSQESRQAAAAEAVAWLAVAREIRHIGPVDWPGPIDWQHEPPPKVHG